jgi:hypothetical protein
MKTKVVLKSSDRDLFGVVIKQETQTSFLSVTDLQKAYEKARWAYGWSDRRVSDVMGSIDTKERVYYILKERDLVKAEISVFMEMVEKEGITKVLKGLGLYKTTGRGENKTVMADPYVWMLLAMELNPMLYAKVVVWMTDTLMFDRVDAGNEFLPMNAAIKSVCHAPDYPRFARAINIKVFGEHKTAMRNLASAKELRKIADIEKFITNAIKQGWLKTEDSIAEAIQNYGAK